MFCDRSQDMHSQAVGLGRVNGCELNAGLRKIADKGDIPG